MSNERSWQLRVGNYYQPLKEEEAEKWNTCPKCHEKPRIWEFDNGRYAKCLCVKSKYESAAVSAEPIMELMRKNNGSWLHYDPDLLRRNWNKHTEEE
jgi:hypothetical protein